MSSVFSIEPEGMTRAWPIVPLMRRNTRPTQNHAITSRWILVFTGKLASACLVFFSAFTFHHHRPLCGRGFVSISMGSFAGFAVGSAFAHLELHQIRGINTRITRRTKLSGGVRDRPAQRSVRNITQRIGPEAFPAFLPLLRR